MQHPGQRGDHLAEFLQAQRHLQLVQAAQTMQRMQAKRLNPSDEPWTRDLVLGMR